MQRADSPSTCFIKLRFSATSRGCISNSLLFVLAKRRYIVNVIHSTFSVCNEQIHFQHASLNWQCLQRAGAVLVIHWTVVWICEEQVYRLCYSFNRRCVQRANSPSTCFIKLTVSATCRGCVSNPLNCCLYLRRAGTLLMTLIEPLVCARSRFTFNVLH